MSIRSFLAMMGAGVKAVIAKVSPAVISTLASVYTKSSTAICPSSKDARHTNTYPCAIFTGNKYQIFLLGSSGYLEVYESSDGVSYSLNQNLSNWFAANFIYSVTSVATDESGGIFAVCYVFPSGATSGQESYIKSTNYGATYSMFQPPVAPDGYGGSVTQYVNGVFFLCIRAASNKGPVIIYSADLSSFSTWTIGSGWSTTVMGYCNYGIAWNGSKWSFPVSTTTYSSDGSGITSITVKIYSSATLGGVLSLESDVSSSTVLYDSSRPYLPGIPTLGYGYLNEKYYIFGSSNWSGGYFYEMISSDAKTWGAKTTKAWTASGITAIYNASSYCAPMISVHNSGAGLALVISNTTNSSDFIWWTSGVTKVVTTSDLSTFTLKGGMTYTKSDSTAVDIGPIPGMWSNVKSTLTYGWRESNWTTGKPVSKISIYKGT